MTALYGFELNAMLPACHSLHMKIQLRNEAKKMQHIRQRPQPSAAGKKMCLKEGCYYY